MLTSGAPRMGQDQLHIVLVEDNPFIRNVLIQCLLHMGFRKLVGVGTGVDAIEYIRADGNRRLNGIAQDVDMVLADFFMSPLNGLQLLQWIRTDKESPNRFMPFLMISGAAEPEQVELARDNGANEFIAKPFSIGSVYARFQKAIDQPRQFVATRTFFGPDRRRHDEDKKRPKDVPKERRREGEDHATIVYTPKEIKRPKKAADVYLFKLPNLLKQRMGLTNARVPFELPKELLNEAEDALEREAQGFLDWAETYLTDLSAKIELAKTDPSNRAAHLQEVNMIAHELRGQGGTFGYPLVTLFAKSLYEATQPPCREDDANLEICKAHLDSLRAVIREKIEGDGGAVGRELFKSLNKAIEKYAH